MRAVLGSLLTAAATAAAGTAFAQAPAELAGNYGGGAILSPPHSLGAPGNVLLGFRITGATRLRFNAGMGVRCGSGYFSGRATLAPDGSFASAGTITRRFRGGVRVRSTYELTGTVAGAAASGTARLRNRIFENGRLTRTCATGSVQWGARRPTGDLGAPGATPSAPLYGTTSQRLEGQRRAIVMRVSSDGAKLVRAAYEVTLTCSSRRTPDLAYGARSRTVIAVYDSPRRNLALTADGAFSDVERFRFRTEAAVLRSTERFGGRLGMAGASGTFSLITRVSSRRTGRTIGTCRSGTVAWTAAV